MARPQSQYPHSLVCQRLIYSDDRSPYSAAGKYCMLTNPGNTYMNGIFVAVQSATQSIFAIIRLRICFHFIRIRIPGSNPAPGPIGIQGFNDQKLEKNTVEKKFFRI
jgi:hypothetical protein